MIVYDNSGDKNKATFTVYEKNVEIKKGNEDERIGKEVGGGSGGGSSSGGSKRRGKGVRRKTRKLKKKY